MKTIQTLIILLAINFSATSQTQDTCDYVHQNNTIGGLDCAMLSLAQFTADTYQWLNCDSSYAQIAGQTSDYYTGVTSINVALEITYLGCTDTSYCQYVCTVGLEELPDSEVEIVRITDLMGRDTKDRPNTLLIYIYSDGTTEKRYRIE